MNIKLVEIDPVTFTYKHLDKSVLRKKARNFKDACMKFIDENINVKKDNASRESLILKCEQGAINDFDLSIGHTYEEYEKLLPNEVDDAWSSFNLYITNCVTKNSEEFVIEHGRYFVSESFLDEAS